MSQKSALKSQPFGTVSFGQHIFKKNSQSVTGQILKNNSHLSKVSPRMAAILYNKFDSEWLVKNYYGVAMISRLLGTR